MHTAHSNAGICRVNEHKPEGQSKIGHEVKVVASNPMLEFTAANLVVSAETATKTMFQIQC
jgi:hypothetical protein